ncbi:glycoside-pentoside-hexuronide (GPH):cation symporter [Ruminococcaceae bacterium OttesenSCG-928-I18]|nr:glycoside-pentoside-hexuronide (GPH):cation symporter [Ruminococcaceae bacterium OttesenSCG-928-I18]
MDKAAAGIGRVSARTKYSYGIGCIGRDANYTLVSNFIMVYLTLGVGLSNWQLGAVGIVVVVARIWDAVNDPLMGTIIDNTHTRFGKFKPYIITGAVLNSFFTVLLFTHFEGVSEGLFVAIFAITYILWGMTYTMNDISYWSLLPNLTVNPVEREKVTSLARIGANIGLFSVTAAVPALTGGQMTTMYPLIAKVVAALFVGCQLLIIFGVQESKSAITKSDNHTSLKDMLRIITKNDQLLVIVLAILLFNIGYFTTAGFGQFFFYFDYGVYGGMEFTYFAITIAVAQIATLALSPLFSKKMTRRQMFTLGTAGVVFGYLALMCTKYLLPMTMVLLCIFGFILFAGQALIQLLNYVMLADTIEYGQWKLGTRNESIVYSLNPFITKLASAVQVGILSLTMIVSGLNPYSEQISELDHNTSLSRAEVLQKGNEIVASIPEQSTAIMRIFMLMVPLCLIVGCYLIFRTKYKLDEATYEKIIRELEERAKTGKEAD